MATNAPTTAIQSGMLTGMFSARMMPVTTADRSPTVLDFFQQLFINVLKRHTGQGGHSDQHQRLHAEDQTRGQHGGQQRNDNIARQPRVVDASRICGEAVTIRRSSMGYLPPFPQLGDVPALGKAHRLANGALGRAGIGAARRLRRDPRSVLSAQQSPCWQSPAQ